MHRSNILTWYVWRTTSARGNALWIHRPRLLQVRTGNKVQFQYDFCMVLSWKWIFSQLGHFRGSRAISWLEESISWLEACLGFHLVLIWSARISMRERVSSCFGPREISSKASITKWWILARETQTCCQNSLCEKRSAAMRCIKMH